MDIVESAEVRWFLEGQPDAGRVRHWFGDKSSEGERVDWYLSSGRSDIGFKARLVKGAPAKVETKYLLGSIGAVELSPGIVGNVERWQKLSVELDDPELRKRGRWVEVRKDRILLKFAWEEGALIPVSTQEKRLPAGAGFELTTVWGDPKVSGYSLGVEAFGPSNQLLTIVQRTCALVFAQAKDLALSEAQSLSYPAWLAKRTSTNA
jgi:hypothetical protein